METGKDHSGFEATVTAIREWGRVEGKQVWQIALDHTDFTTQKTGTLETFSKSGARLLVHIRAVTADEDGTLWHTCDRPLQEGTAVTGRVD